jgi:hypothetical protein
MVDVKDETREAKDHKKHYIWIKSNIKLLLRNRFEGVDWIQLARDRIQWLVLLYKLIYQSLVVTSYMCHLL